MKDRIKEIEEKYHNSNCYLDLKNNTVTIEISFLDDFKFLLDLCKNRKLGKDITDRYIGMIESFEWNMNLPKDRQIRLSSLQQLIDEKDFDVLKDIKLLKELSFNLRNKKCSIVMEE